MSFIYTLLSDKRTRNILSLCVIVVSIVAIFHLIKAEGADWYYKNNPEIMMEEIPFYNIIKKHDPKLYTRIEADIKSALANEHEVGQLTLKVRGYLDQIVSQRVPMANNEAVIAYTKITLDEMRALQKQGYGLCHRFLYPTSQPLNLGEYLHKDLISADIEALTKVIQSSYENPLPTPQSSEVKLYLSHVYTQLLQEHGQSLDVLSTPLDSRIDKDKVCEMTIALFDEILKLPAKQSGETLRYIVQSNQE